MLGKLACIEHKVEQAQLQVQDVLMKVHSNLLENVVGDIVCLVAGDHVCMWFSICQNNDVSFMLLLAPLAIIACLQR